MGLGYAASDALAARAGLFGARTKILLLLGLSLAAILAPFEVAALYLPAAIIAFYAARVDLHKAGLNTIGIAALFIFAARALLQPNAERVFFGIVSAEGIYFGALNAAYLAGFLLFIRLFTLTTKPSEMAAGLVGVGLSKRRAFSFSIAMLALPFFWDKLKKARIAQASRGVKNKFTPITLPVLHAAFSRAKRMSIALESRGFSAEKL